MPTRTDGNASRMNSHCQPSSPQPVTLSNSPEIGDPMMDEIGIASMNRADDPGAVNRRETTGSDRR